MTTALPTARDQPVNARKLLRGLRPAGNPDVEPTAAEVLMFSEAQEGQ
jgi:hypothetical protein